MVGFLSISVTFRRFENLKKEAEELNNFPYRGRIVPELKYHNIESYRELIISSWRIIYRIEDVKLFILAVFDGRRNLEDILSVAWPAAHLIGIIVLYLRAGGI